MCVQLTVLSKASSSHTMPIWCGRYKIPWVSKSVDSRLRLSISPSSHTSHHRHDMTEILLLWHKTTTKQTKPTLLPQCVWRCVCMWRCVWDRKPERILLGRGRWDCSPPVYVVWTIRCGHYVQERKFVHLPKLWIVHFWDILPICTCVT